LNLVFSWPRERKRRVWFVLGMVVGVDQWRDERRKPWRGCFKAVIIKERWLPCEGAAGTIKFKMGWCIRVSFCFGFNLVLAAALRIIGVGYFLCVERECEKDGFFVFLFIYFCPPFSLCKIIASSSSILDAGWQRQLDKKNQ
jgi:hypothetical protein